MPYIYIIHCRASVNCNESVYKIGKTKNFEKRLSGYDKGSIPILLLFVKNSDSFETYMKTKFTSIFIKRQDYGNEYFEGDVNKMVSVILNEFNKEIQYKTETEETEETETKTEPKIEWWDLFDTEEFKKYQLYKSTGIWYYKFNIISIRDNTKILQHLSEIKQIMNDTSLSEIEKEYNYPKYR